MEKHSNHTLTTDTAEKENLANIASLFICHRIGTNMLNPNPNRQLAEKRTVLFLPTIKRFVLHMLRDFQPSEDAVFGSLMIFERIRNLRPEFFGFVTPEGASSFGKLCFTCSLIIAVNVIAGVDPPKMPIIDIGLNGPDQWEETRTNIWKSAQAFEEVPLFQRITIQMHEAWALDILDGDISFNMKMLTRFKKAVSKDAQQGQSQYYPRNFVTEHPVFLRKPVWMS